jgi:hypothetical protein
MAAASPLIERSSAFLLKLSSGLKRAASGLRHRSSQNTTGDSIGSSTWSFEKTRCSTSLIGDHRASTDTRPEDDVVEDGPTGVSRPAGRNTPSGDAARERVDMPRSDAYTQPPSNPYPLLRPPAAVMTPPRPERLQSLDTPEIVVCTFTSEKHARQDQV